MLTSKFKIAALVALAGGFLLSARAAWYWPFDLDPDSTNKPPRLHRLLEKANEYIELAEDEALDGNAEKAISNYREALKELDRVEEENPERADSPEFAPLRTKRATCSAAIDSIRFAQVNENERAVSVSNTTDLERKWRRKHGLQTPADEEFERQEAARTNQVETAEQPATNKVEAVETAPQTNAVAKVEEPVNEAKAAEADAAEFAREHPAPPSSTNNATGLIRLERDQRMRNKLPIPESDGSVDGQIKVALTHIHNEDYAAADQLMEALLKDHPKNLNVLLIRAASQTGAGNKFAARRTLERAMRAHPKSYLPYYNLANLALQLGEDASVAREYYELGRSVGGPRNEALERKLK
ncbi:MAG: tetratricopeptide repeat protein [Kiritimatiellia bacterium]